MAHYDSVPFAPGAGDDGAGVATLLEIARVAAQTHRKPRNSVLFAFTDGEEAGFARRRGLLLAARMGATTSQAVINLEGSGSARPVSAVAQRPTERSRTRRVSLRGAVPGRVVVHREELFKHLPNDTDLSVSESRRETGYRFRVRRRTQPLPLSRRLDRESQPRARCSITARTCCRSCARSPTRICRIGAANYVYTTPTQSFWLAYRPQTGFAIAICIVALLGLATWRRWQGPGHFFAALGIVGLALATIGRARTRDARARRSALPVRASRGPPIRGHGGWSSTRFRSSALALQRPLVTARRILELAAGRVVVLDAADARDSRGICRWRHT